MSPSRPSRSRRAESNIRKIDEILECHLVSGGYDDLLRFITRNISHDQELMESIPNRNIGIEKYFGYIVIKSPVVKNTLPLRSLLNLD